MESSIGKYNYLKRKSFFATLGAIGLAAGVLMAQPSEAGAHNQVDVLPTPVIPPPPAPFRGVLTSFEELNHCDYGLETQTGKASYYTWNGCLGCRSDRMMRNGEIYDDTKLTLANNYFDLNSDVVVSNEDTGISSWARVTDTHGSATRIADLSAALASRLNLETDVTEVGIRLILCRPL